jgi:hypothetical protein
MQELIIDILTAYQYYIAAILPQSIHTFLEKKVLGKSEKDFASTICPECLLHVWMDRGEVFTLKDNQEHGPGKVCIFPGPLTAHSLVNLFYPVGYGFPGKNLCGKAIADSCKGYDPYDGEQERHDPFLLSMMASWINPLNPRITPAMRPMKVKFGAMFVTRSRYMPP